MLTAFLMFVIMAVATDARAVGAGAAMAIGGVIGLAALVVSRLPATALPVAGHAHHH